MLFPPLRCIPPRTNLVTCSPPTRRLIRFPFYQTTVRLFVVQTITTTTTLTAGVKVRVLGCIFQYFCCVALWCCTAASYESTTPVRMYNPQRDTFRAIPCEPPTDDCMRACQRRNLLITPDRRSFIQSMNHECARRISGNSVPATSERGVFAYSFPTQYYSQGAALPSSSRYHAGTMGANNNSPAPAGNGRSGTPSRSVRGDAPNSAARLRYNEDVESYGTPNARAHYQNTPPQSSSQRSENRSGHRRD